MAPRNLSGLGKVSHKSELFVNQKEKGGVGADIISWIKNWMTAQTLSMNLQCLATDQWIIFYMNWPNSQIPPDILQTIKCKVFKASLVMKRSGSPHSSESTSSSSARSPSHAIPNVNIYSPKGGEAFSLLRIQQRLIQRALRIRIPQTHPSNSHEHYVVFFLWSFKNFWTTYTIFNCLNYLIPNKAQEFFPKHASHNLPALQAVIKSKYNKLFFLETCCFRKGGNFLTF